MESQLWRRVPLRAPVPHRGEGGWPLGGESALEEVKFVSLATLRSPSFLNSGRRRFLQNGLRHRSRRGASYENA
jgi:hypothetical protein